MDSSQYVPPVRRALSDEEIADFVAKSNADEAGMLAAMKLIEDQVALRAAEEMEFEIWAVKMVQIGSPESLGALAKARGESEPEFIATEADISEPLISAPVVETVIPSTSTEHAYVSDDDIVAALNDAYSTPVVSETPLSQVPVESQPVSEKVAPATIEADEEETPAVEVPVIPIPDRSLDDFDLMLSSGSVEDEVTAEQDHQPVAEPVPFQPHSSVALDAPIVVQSNSAFGQFWVWLALGAGIGPIAFAWYIALAGAPFLTSLLVGVGTIALGAFVVATGSLAGKRSGLSTLVVSRAAFGVHGNFLPASFVLVAKFLIALLGLLLVVSGVNLSITTAGASIPATNSILLNIGTAAQLSINWGLVYAIVLLVALAPIAILGRRTLRVTQIVGGSAAVVAIGLAVYSTLDLGNLSNLSFAFDNKNLLSLVGAALIGLSAIVLVGGTAGADFADSLTRAARGRSVFGWVALSLVVIPSVIFGFALAKIKSTSVLEFATWVTTFDQRWLIIVLTIAVSLTLFSLLAANLYSLRKALSGMRLNWSSVALVVSLAAALAVAFGLITQGNELASQIAVFVITWTIPLLVIVLAWSGVLVSDVLLRRIAYHEVSLNRAYGFYKSTNWINILGLIVAIVLGLGLIKPWGTGIEFFGYLLPLIGSVESAGAMQLGLIVAFFVGALWPVAFGIPRIKQQEVEILETESRRSELKDVFGVADF